MIQIRGFRGIIKNIAFSKAAPKVNLVALRSLESEKPDANGKIITDWFVGSRVQGGVANHP